ncbi:hypothetical protein GOV04_05050 [Candidatus Woesearchaeota archaeon]|nr:hypothetical protein [Candidatus Woesearchaeota archaeon]
MRQIKELYGLVITSKIRHGILKTLDKKSPLLQSEIAKKMKRKQQDISKAVYQLEKEKLIECLTPSKGSYKAYMITKLGKEVLRYEI